MQLDSPEARMMQALLNQWDTSIEKENTELLMEIELAYLKNRKTSFATEASQIETPEHIRVFIQNVLCVDWEQIYDLCPLVHNWV